MSGYVDYLKLLDNPNPSKPPTKAEDYEEEMPELKMGFGASQGNPEGAKHKHEFGSIPCLTTYCKGGDFKKDYLTVFCSCGETKEILVADRS